VNVDGKYVNIAQISLVAPSVRNTVADVWDESGRDIKRHLGYTTGVETVVDIKFVDGRTKTLYGTTAHDFLRALPRDSGSLGPQR